jgi:hypothetical protein
MHSRISDRYFVVYFLLDSALITSLLIPCIRTFRILLRLPSPVLAASELFTLFFQWDDGYTDLEFRFHTAGSVWQHFSTLTACRHFQNPSHMPRC